MPTSYEQRTDSVTVGQVSGVLRLCSTLGWPTLEAGGFAKYLVGYFTSAMGELHHLIHLGRFGSDDDRREFWKRLCADKDFMAFAVRLRPLIETQVNQRLLATPWGPALSAAPSLLEAVRRRPATACTGRPCAPPLTLGDRDPGCASTTMPPRRAQAAPRPEGVADAQAVVGASASAARRGGACVGSAGQPPLHDVSRGTKARRDARR
jgi:hypothetical protein